MEMGHVARLPLNELKVNWDKRGSGAAGFACAFACVCVFYMWCCERGLRGMGG